MARHGNRRQLKRLAKPKAIPIRPKGSTFLKKASPGAHKLKESVPLSILLKEVLKLASKDKEARKAVREGRVLVDQRKVKDASFSVGLMDVVTISGEKSKNYRLTFKKGKLTLLEISQDEAKEKLCKITGKSTLRKKLVQLNLHDGRNVVADGEFKTGDTIKISLPTQKIDGVIKLEKGVKCYVSHGKHSGETATLKELVERGGSVATDAKLSIGKNEFITRKEYLFAVDEGFKTK